MLYRGREAAGWLLSWFVFSRDGFVEWQVCGPPAVLSVWLGVYMRLLRCSNAFLRVHNNRLPNLVFHTLFMLLRLCARVGTPD